MQKLPYLRGSTHYANRLTGEARKKYEREVLGGLAPKKQASKRGDQWWNPDRLPSKKKWESRLEQLQSHCEES